MNADRRRVLAMMQASLNEPDPQTAMVEYDIKLLVTRRAHDRRTWFGVRLFDIAMFTVYCRERVADHEHKLGFYEHRPHDSTPADFLATRRRMAVYLGWLEHLDHPPV
jgi:hypothetical protein